MNKPNTATQVHHKRAGQVTWRAAWRLIIGGLSCLGCLIGFIGIVGSTGCTLQTSPPFAPPPKPLFNLTKRVEVLNARIVSSPCTSIDTPPVKGTCHEVLLNGAITGRRRSATCGRKSRDDAGNELPYSLDTTSIFVAPDPKDRIAKGRVYDEPVRSGHTLLMGENTLVKVKVTVAYADNSPSN